MALRAQCSISLLCYGCDNYIVSVLGIQFSLSLPELLCTLFRGYPLLRVWGMSKLRGFEIAFSYCNCRFVCMLLFDDFDISFSVCRIQCIIVFSTLSAVEAPDSVPIIVLLLNEFEYFVCALCVLPLQNRKYLTNDNNNIIIMDFGDGISSRVSENINVRGGTKYV